MRLSLFDRIFVRMSSLQEQRDRLSVVMGCINQAVTSERWKGRKIVQGPLTYISDGRGTPYFCFHQVDFGGVRELPAKAIAILYKNRNEFLQSLPETVKMRAEDLIRYMDEDTSPLEELEKEPGRVVTIPKGKYSELTYINSQMLWLLEEIVDVGGDPEQVLKLLSDNEKRAEAANLLISWAT